MAPESIKTERPELSLEPGPLKNSGRIEIFSINFFNDKDTLVCLKSIHVNDTCLDLLLKQRTWECCCWVYLADLWWTSGRAPILRKMILYKSNFKSNACFFLPILEHVLYFTLDRFFWKTRMTSGTTTYQQND